ncbi:MAG: zeta toxin family protein [Bacteroidales bacterium]|nr:zeta toxin family protein [Bacteroidales bacterium]
MPKLFIICGCNGAGKTTASYTILPEMLNFGEFVNADEIAKKLDPFKPEDAALRASRLMIERIDELLSKKADLAIETTLATRTLVKIIKDAKELGYTITLIYFWLNMPELAIERVRLRVASGGHNVPEETIRRRYSQGISNLFSLYLPIVDYWILIDNSNVKIELIAEGGKDILTKIHNKTLYNLLIHYERT